MAEQRTSKLGEILFAERLIELYQLKEALETQKSDNRKLGELLVEKGWIDDTKLSEILAKTFHLPFVRLSDVSIDQAALKLIDPDLMQAYKILPIAVNDEYLTVATNDPLNVAALQEIQFKSGHLVKPVMASLKDIEMYLQKCLGSVNTIDHAVNDISSQEQGSTAIKLVESIIKKAIRERASDVHLEAQKDRMRVRFRIDGELFERAIIPKDLERNVISRVKILAGLDVAESRRPQDGRITFTEVNDVFDIRVATLPDIQGENVVLRILNKKFTNRSFESLGMSTEEADILKNLMTRPYGLILVTGPTGAGKTTTLYSVLNQLNQISKNIISVEDPVEYELEGIIQTANNSFTGYTFANAIRHILRHDPDIIMVGEIRDVETAEVAIRAALTGHLVLSTIHTNTAAGAITRLLEMGVEPFLISSAVIGVIAQRLVRKLCPHCRQEVSPDDEVTREILKAIAGEGPFKIAEPTGCDKCLHSGYQGRLGVFELLSIDKDIRRMILQSANEDEINEAAIRKGMKTLKAGGIKKVLERITSLEEIMRITLVE